MPFQENRDDQQTQKTKDFYFIFVVDKKTRDDNKV